jgi:trigger factor
LKVEYQEQTSVRKALAFEIESELVDREIEDRARDYAKKAKLPGFRPGKTPAAVIRQRFKTQILEDVAEKLVNKVVFDELEGRGLKPVARPKVEDLKIDEGSPLTFRAVFEILPIVELPDWHGLRAKRRTAKLEQADVDRELDRLRESRARFDPVDPRPVQAGDFLVADVQWHLSDGGRSRRNENAMIEVGAADNHADLNAALVGMQPGETKELRLLQQPEPGQEGGTPTAIDYKVTPKAIKRKLVPAADDDFAKDLGDFASLAELRADVERRLREAEERRGEREVRAELVKALVDKASFEVPEALVEHHMTARAESAARGLALQGIDPTKIGMDWRQYRDGQREEALRAAKADILIEEIARREAIQPSEAEVEAELQRLAERTRRSREALRAQMEKEGELGALRARLREDKVLDLLRSSATLENE